MCPKQDVLKQENPPAQKEPEEAKKREAAKITPVPSFVVMSIDITGIGERKIQLSKELFERMISESKYVMKGPGPACAEFLSLPEVQNIISKNGLNPDSFVSAIQDSLPSSVAGHIGPIAITLNPKEQAGEYSLYVGLKTPSIEAFEQDMWLILDDVKSGKLGFSKERMEAWRDCMKKKFLSVEKPPGMTHYLLGEETVQLKNGKQQYLDEFIAGLLKKHVDEVVPADMRHKYKACVDWAVKQKKETRWATLGFVSQLLDIREKAGKDGSIEVGLGDFLNFAYELRVSTYVPLKRADMTHGLEVGFNPVTYSSLNAYLSKQWVDGWKEYGVNLYLQPVSTTDLIAGTGLSLRKFACNVPLFNISKGALPFERESFQGFMFGFGGIGFGVMEGGNASFFAGPFHMPLSGSKKGTISFASPWLLFFYGISGGPEIYSTIATAELTSLGVAAGIKRFADFFIPTQTVREIINIFDLLVPNITKDETSYHELKNKISQVNALIKKSEYNDAWAILRDMLNHAPTSAVANPFVKGYLNFLADKAIEKEIVHMGGGKLKPSVAIYARVQDSLGRLEKLVKKLEAGQLLTMAEQQEFFTHYSYLYLKTSLISRDGGIFDLSALNFKSTEDYVRYVKLLYGASFYFSDVRQEYSETLAGPEKEKFSFGLLLFAEMGRECDPALFAQFYDVKMKKGELKGKAALKPEIAYFMLAQAKDRVLTPLYQQSALAVEHELVELESALADMEQNGISVGPTTAALQAYYAGAFDISALIGLERYARIYSTHLKISKLKEYAEATGNSALLERVKDYESRLALIAKKTKLRPHHEGIQPKNAAIEELTVLGEVLDNLHDEVIDVQEAVEKSAKAGIKTSEKAFGSFQEIWKKYEKEVNMKGFAASYFEEVEKPDFEKEDKELAEEAHNLRMLGKEKHLKKGIENEKKGNENSWAVVSDILALQVLEDAAKCFPEKKAELHSAIKDYRKKLEQDLKALDDNFLGMGFWEPHTLGLQSTKIARFICADMGLSGEETEKFVESLSADLPARAMAGFAKLSITKLIGAFQAKIKKLDPTLNQLEARRMMLEDLKARVEYGSIKFATEKDKEEMLEKIEDAIEETKDSLKKLGDVRTTTVSQFQNCLKYGQLSMPLTDYKYYLSSIGVAEF